MPIECSAELRPKEPQPTTHNLLMQEVGRMSDLIDLERCNDLDRLLRVTARIFLFLKRLRGVRVLSLSELTKTAEVLLI